MSFLSERVVESFLRSVLRSMLPQKHDLVSAFYVLDQGFVYTSTGSSTRGPDGRVSTAVLRGGYVPSTVLVTVDVSNAIRRPETVAIVSSLCATENVTLSAVRAVLSPTSVEFNFSAPTGPDGVDEGYLVAIDTNGTIAPDSSLNFETSFCTGECLYCNDSAKSVVIKGKRTSCSTVIRFQEHEIIYKLSTGVVTPERLVNQSTSVEPAIAVLFIPGYILSVLRAPSLVQNANFTRAFAEGIADTNFLQGYFDTGSYNYMHSTVCSSVSQTLANLWGIAQPNYNLTAVPLFNGLQIQTFVSSLHMAVLTGSVSVATLLVCLVGMTYSEWSPINIKDATENALIEALSKDVLKRKRKTPTTNDPAKQRELAFKHTDADEVILYCRENKYVDENGIGICKVSISYDPKGDLPDKGTDYL